MKSTIMIQRALGYIQDRLNQHLKNEFRDSDVRVMLSNMVNPDGSVATKTAGNIVFFLLGINEETEVKNSLPRGTAIGKGTFAQNMPPLHLSFQILFCANFNEDKYKEGVAYLSSVLRFFHENRIMTHDPKRNKKDAIGRLSFELCKLDFLELSQLWAAVGSTLMPSLVYKVSMLLFDDVPVARRVPSISEPDRPT